MFTELSAGNVCKRIQTVAGEAEIYERLVKVTLFTSYAHIQYILTTQAVLCAFPDRNNAGAFFKYETGSGAG